MASPSKSAASKGLIPPGKEYIYTPLTTPTSIRLVRIKPVRDGMESLIELSMRIVDLSDQPNFEALSYTWGRPLTVFPTTKDRDTQDDGTMPVIVDGKGIEVRYNLYRFLFEWRRLRAITAQPTEAIQALMEKTGLNLSDELWIDALCINQEDLDEKNTQVAMMGRIFSQTRKVTVWLGPEDPFTRTALNILMRLAKMPRRQAHAIRSLGTEGNVEAFGLPPTSSSEWWAVFAFLRRSWFSRIWVVQELALAPRVQILCGLLNFTWSTLINGCINLVESGLAESVDSNSWFEIEGPGFGELLWTDDLEPIITQVDRLEEDRHLFTNLENKIGGGHQYVLGLEVIAAGGGKSRLDEDEVELPYIPGVMVGERPQRVPVLHLLDSCRGYSATDPRDKVYALLEIAKRPVYEPLITHEGFRPIEIDYRLSAAEIYINVAWHELLTSDALNLLCRQNYPSKYDIATKVDGLPSWVPDWSTVLRTYRLNSDAESKWAASRELGWRPLSGAPTSGPILTLQGALVDTVTKVQDASDLVSLTKAAVVASGLPEVYPWVSDEQDRGEVLWRTLIADTAEGKHPAPIAYHAAFHAKWFENGKRAAREYYSSEGISDPEKEAEWERYWRHSQYISTRAAEKVPLPGEVDPEPELEERDEGTVGVAGLLEETSRRTEELQLDSGEEARSKGKIYRTADSDPQSPTVDLHEGRESPDAPLSQFDIMLRQLDKTMEDALKSIDSDSNKAEESEASSVINSTENIIKANSDKIEEDEVTENLYDMDDDDNDDEKHDSDDEDEKTPYPKKAELSAEMKRIIHELENRWNRVSMARVVFRTEKQYLGVGPRSMQPGDQVWVLAGSSTPFVLRPNLNGRFMMIGEAYVHGIMHGEAFDRAGFTLRKLELE